MLDLISPDDMNITTLFDIFRAADLKPELAESGDVFFTGPSGLSIIVNLQDSGTLIASIRYYTYFSLNQSVSRVDKLELANALNSYSTCVRFSLYSDEALLAEHYLPYRESVTLLQIMSSMKLFDEITIPKIRDLDFSEICK
jgi:hypothetical protein